MLAVAILVYNYFQKSLVLNPKDGLRELLEKAYEFMKQFVIAGVNLLERFLESVRKIVERKSYKDSYMQLGNDCNLLLMMLIYC